MYGKILYNPAHRPSHIIVPIAEPATVYVAPIRIRMLVGCGVLFSPRRLGNI